MRRNCNLELCLLPYSTDSWSNINNNNNPKMEEITSEEIPQVQQKPQQITIFYNGSVCTSEVTALQARAIIRLASGGGIDEILTKSPTNFVNSQSQMTSPSSSALHMKRSLQQFLQKRKHRAKTASPY
ncbi:hypothetical protein ACFE04_029985 [Oxalis oulophora]